MTRFFFKKQEIENIWDLKKYRSCDEKHNDYVKVSVIYHCKGK